MRADISSRFFRTLIAARSRGRCPSFPPSFLLESCVRRTNASQLFFVPARRRGTSIVTRRARFTDDDDDDHYHYREKANKRFRFPTRWISRATRDGTFFRLPILTSRFQFARASFFLATNAATYGTGRVRDSHLSRWQKEIILEKKRNTDQNTSAEQWSLSVKKRMYLWRYNEGERDCFTVAIRATVSTMICCKKKLK